MTIYDFVLRGILPERRSGSRTKRFLSPSGMIEEEGPWKNKLS